MTRTLGPIAGRVAGVLAVVLLSSCWGRSSDTTTDPAGSTSGSATNVVTGPTPTSSPTSASPPAQASVDALPSARSERWDNLSRTIDPRRAPARIVIVALGVDAPVAPMGVAPDGALDLPEDNATVAWFADGAEPGAAGAALLAAHVDHDGRRGVFFGLRDLGAGAEIVVTSADGAVQTFVVDGPPSNVQKSALPRDQIFRTDGPPALVLVTCGGRFDRVTRSYEDNTIVTARPAAPPVPPASPR